MTTEQQQPFLSHLEELRTRLIRAVIAIAIFSGAAYFFAEELFKILVAPLKQIMPEGDRLIFTNLPEMFFAYIKVAFITGVLAASPIIFYELWMFVSPGLYQKEKKHVFPFVIFSSILFAAGVAFGYFVVCPLGFNFFIGFSNEYVQALPSVKQYFSFAIKMLFAFGIAFELPIVMFFLAKIGIVTPILLKEKRKYAILMTFVIAAILTPPDIISQCMMAGPLIILYEVGIMISHLARNQKKEENNKEDKR